MVVSRRASKKKKVVEIDRLVTSYLILFRIFYFCFLWLAQFSGVFLWSQTFRTELSIKSICVNLLQGQNAGWAVSATDLQLSASCKGQSFPLLCNSLFFSFIIRVPGRVIFLLNCNLYLPGVRWKYLCDMQAPTSKDLSICNHSFGSHMTFRDAAHTAVKGCLFSSLESILHQCLTLTFYTVWTQPLQEMWKRWEQ